MRINEAGILVIAYGDLVPEIVSSANFKNLRNRGTIDATRAHKGQPSEIHWHSLPQKYQDVFVEIHGNPAEVVRATALEHYLKSDSTAREYYRGFVAGHKFLPEQHIDKYSRQSQWLEVSGLIAETKKADLFKMGFNTRTEAYEALFILPAYKESGLPCNYSKLMGKLRVYLPTGTSGDRDYSALVSSKFGNKNSEKIGEDQRRWLIAHYSNPALKYDVQRLFLDFNRKALEQGWDPCENPISMQLWLNKPENKKLWWGAKHGERKGRTELSYTLRTKMPTMRDSLWYSDGTKLNFYDAEGKLAPKYTVYEVHDAFSDVLLGFSIGKSENFQMQYVAYKMALQFSGHKPYEIKYDNAGGHKKMESEQFLDRISRLNIRTMPYNGRSKSIESVFNRLQSKYMGQEWFFTGQNITSKKANSKANREFIAQNLKHLPSIEELVEIYAGYRDEWNNEIQANGKSRLQIYQESFNPETPELSTLDFVELFWFEKPEPITYWNHGITIQTDKTKHEYEVLNADGMPDTQFRAEHVQRKFIIKYDPADASHIRLYESGTGRFVAIAQPRLTVQRNVQEQGEGGRAKIDSLLAVSKFETDSRKQFIRKLWDENNINPEEIVKRGSRMLKKNREEELVPVLKSEADVLKHESYEEPEDNYLDKW